MNSNKTGKGGKETRNKSKKTALILKDIVLPSIQIISSIVIAVVSISIMNKANTITDAANMLQINSVIQLRTDLVSSLEKEHSEFTRNMEKQGYDETIVEIAKSLRNAKISLLNAYELACTLYSENKIDKNTFRLYYGEIIKDIVVKYSEFIVENEQEPYSEIKKIYKEWQ